MIPSVTNDQIIELATIYAQDPLNQSKDLHAYLRDAAYYGFGYIFNRMSGLSHDDALDRFSDASSKDGYYKSMPQGMLDDDTIINFSNVWMTRYETVGRLRHQSNVDNARDEIYWLIVYVRYRSDGYTPDIALQQMQNGMAVEAQLAPPYPPSKVILESLITDGRLIRLADSKNIFSWKGVSAFPLIHLFEQGQDLTPWLELFQEYNLFRVFWYTAWTGSGWNLPTANVLVKFHEYMLDNGFYIENVCATDNNLSLLPDIKNLIGVLKDSKLSNVLFEAVNEPYIYDKLDPSLLKGSLNATPYLYSSGIYTDNELDKFYGRYITTHTSRDNEGVRKAKDLEELSSRFRIPAIADEPFKTIDGFSDLDFYTYAALSKLMGAGATYHFESQKFGSLPNVSELSASKMFLRGLNLYPLDAQLGQYAHLQDLEEKTEKALRVFRKGNYSIVVRNKGVTIPFNWKSLDEFKVGYQIL